ncbi:hypothetical protein M408DRAFT_23703 [Serendipita vermifera MAFF 305830]|uniref:Uncharacterized protein n=1 Tax=Serendipita vermifera MAFF 305830 TaxID=933852 RepID=A0A0C3BB57_SERVB|nr:hypothetical protein M408DRAFT_23703 [Serendipita vermifera MAFF 305830]
MQSGLSKLSAAVMKKANINVMLGTVSMPQLDADLSNAQQVHDWQRNASIAVGYILGSSAQKLEFMSPTSLMVLSCGANPRQSTLALPQLLASQGLRSSWKASRLDPTKDLHFSLIKDKALTKNSAISMATTVESGLLAVTSPFDLAFNARSGPSSGAPSPSVKAPCKWCIGKQRHAEALKHTLEQCTGLEASIQHMVSKNSNTNKQPSKPKQQSAAKPAVEEFAGKASSSDSFSSSPADNYWIPDSGATSYSSG